MDYPPSPILSSKQKSSRFIKQKKLYGKQTISKNIFNLSSSSVPDTNLLEDGNDTRISDLVNTIITGTKKTFCSTPQQIAIEDEEPPTFSPIRKLPCSRKLKPIQLSEDSLKAASKIFEDIFEHSTPHRKHSEFVPKKSGNFETSTFNDDSSDFFSTDISDTQMIQIVDEITMATTTTIVPEIDPNSPEKDFRGFTDSYLTVTNNNKDQFVENFQQWTAESPVLTFANELENFQGFNECELFSESDALSECEGFSECDFEHNCLESLKLKIKELKDAFGLKRPNDSPRDSHTVKKIKISHSDSVCFQAASNKKVKIDSNLIKETESLFRSSEESSDNKENIFKNSENLANRQIQAKEEVLEKAPSILDSNNFGFSTASNKKVQISAKSLENARNLLNECAEDDPPGDIKSSKTLASLKVTNNFGFSTASNKKVQISAKSLENARNLLNECSEDDSPGDIKSSKTLESLKVTNNFGFSTASNKKVQISAKSLENARNLLNECAEDDSPGDIKSSKTLKYANIKKANSTSGPVTNNFGFSTASNKKVQISAKSLENARNLLNESSEDDPTAKNLTVPKPNLINKHITPSNFEKSNSSSASVPNNFGFFTASNKKVEISKKSLENARNLLKDCSEEDLTDQSARIESKPLDQKNLQTKNNSDFGFFTASSKKVEISKKSLENARNLLKDCSEEDPTDQSAKIEPKPLDQKNLQIRNPSDFGFFTATNRKIEISKKSLENARGLLKDCSEQVELAEIESLENVRNLFRDCSEDVFMDQNPKFDQHISDTTLNSVQSIFENLEDTDFDLIDQNHPETVKNDPNANVNFFTGSNKTVDVSSKALENARNLFEDCAEEAFDSINQNQRPEEVELQPDVKRQAQDITNLENVEGQNSDLEIDEENNSKEETLIEDIDMYTDDICSSSDTDINENTAANNIKVSNKRIKDQLIQNIAANSATENNSEPPSVTFQIPTAGNSNDWMRAIDQECENLRNQLKIMETRKTFLDLQISKLHSIHDSVRFELGSLIRSKENNVLNRKSLRDFVHNRHPICAVPPNTENKMFFENLWNITPENAHNFHFYLPSPPHPPVIKLDDDAYLIPTTSNFAGMSEFHAAFDVLPGVDRKRIPDGWFRNHFRWIIWKLASMDRQFPGEFDGYFLTPKNVMAQLKYRYDRDVYNNQRSALRIITEKDETSCRRMVLCVAKIVLHSGKEPEIELFDGWYSLRAIFDPLLLQCIKNGKISVGTKLLTYGAELLNSSEASHPFQVPANVRLKLHGNSTRRVKWDTKLGFQRHHGPFLTSLHSIKPDGGHVGHIFVVVSRVLPLKYLEKAADNTWVCRCRRSEARQQRLWEKEQEKYLERAQQEVITNLENEWRAQSENFRKNCDNIQEIRCPRTLLHILENSSDPGDINELLTESQRESVRNYQSKLNIQRQEEISTKIRTVLDHRGFKERIVHSVLQVILVDANKPNISCTYTLEIWNPDDSLTQFLKDGTTLDIYSLTAASRDRLLKSTKSTRYLRTAKKISFDCDLWGPCYFRSIEQMQQPNFHQHRLQFCDTVGVIVQLLSDNSTSMCVWLADANYKLLRIQYIMDPNNCLAFQGFREGDVVAVFNIKVLKPAVEMAHAQIDYVTTVSKDATDQYIRNELNVLKKQILSMNMEEFLENCSDKIQESSFY